MNQLNQVDRFAGKGNKVSGLRKQLMREIHCLEQQLERIKQRGDLFDLTTLKTYEEMINSRRESLDNLPWEDQQFA